MIYLTRNFYMVSYEYNLGRSQYWDGSLCLSKKNHNQSCGISNECLDSEKTLCISTKCLCKNGEYFRQSEAKCVPRLNEFETCSFDAMCLRPMFCSIRFGCRCPKYYFYENVTSTCTHQYTLNERCDKDHQCRDDLGLTCQNNKCSCSTSDYTWSPDSTKCKLTYAKKTCSSDLECNDSEKLVCRSTGLCNCPTTSVNGMCDCARINNNENYWNGTMCLLAKNHGSSCSHTYECKYIGQNTICNASNLCACTDYKLFFWQNWRCRPKRSFGNGCSNSIQCLDSQLTTCNGSHCVCATHQYFNGSQCTERHYEFESCSSDNMCYPPLTCAANNCSCASNQFFENSTLSCVPKLKNGSYCDKDWQCRSDLGLTCRNNECICSEAGKEWSSVSDKCYLTYGYQTCNIDSECHDDHDLICSVHNCSCPKISLQGMCDCVRTIGDEKYWNGKKCTLASSYGHNCSQDFHCQTLTQKTICVQDLGICDCAELSIQFFDGSECISKKKFMESCDSNSQCLDSELTFCNTTHCVCNQTQYFDLVELRCLMRLSELEVCSFKEMCLEDMDCNGTHCKCPGNKFYDSQSLLCTEQREFNEPCDYNLQCRQDLDLVCSGNKCVCASLDKVWSNSETKCLLTYGKMSCSANNHCNSDQNLKCIMESCNCSRIQGNEEYWNGSYCVAAVTYDQPCSHDYQCQIITENTKCDGGKCLCSNNTMQFWDGFECISKKRHLQSCNENSNCLDSDLTECLSSICSCPTGKYYNETNQRCQPRLGQSESCFNTTMCLEGLTCDLSHVCSCPIDQFYINSSVGCSQKKLVNSSCNSDYECSVSKGLTCQNNLCQCSPTTHTWNSNECKKTYDQSCNSDDECNSLEHLFCIDQTNRCNCPSTQTGKICDCKKSEDKYWDGLSCKNTKSFGAACSDPYECSSSKELTCLNEVCRCDLDKTYKTSSQKCEPSPTCSFNAIYYDGVCYHFSIENQLADDVQSKGCNQLKNNNGQGTNSGWTQAVVHNSGVRDFFKNHLASISSKHVYWLDKRDKMDDNNDNDDIWKSTNGIIDYSLCAGSPTNILDYMYFQEDCFYDNISKETQHRYICEKMCNNNNC
ncbi:prion-like-(Q N-rich) domain-bearing 25 [Brachionus plicatilis]|uniref:Prion-like-(Q N-rich) domain-bearing 25 n=1 Tax=Brachionus plicatilis TaxID=10195 RepID=A0A3M7S7H4_BRAPC|nr:prion-like-(Q N-rich) domain-bearing 25 [Brachionus plicatilis]